MSRYALIVLALLVFAQPAAAQALPDGYPNKPIRFLVAFAPGGGTDILARLIAHHMSRSIGQNVVVENRAGASGTIQPEEMPYDAGAMVPGLPVTVFDEGNYPGVLRRALEEFRYQERLAGKRQTDQRLYGVGIGCFVESTGGGPAESARIRVTAAGRVELYVGSSSMGQGHETTMAQILADELGVPPECIDVFHGSTSFVERGWGTYHSRSVVMGGSAIVLAARKIREQAGGGLIESEALEASAIYTSSTLTYTFGTQLAHVAVDPATGAVEVLAFLTVEDVGRMINPAIVHGQAIGACVQGLGATFLDQFVHDENGQLLTGSFADYLLPTATDFPFVEAISLEESPSKSNPLRAKGAGEGGIAATGGALANAVDNALRPLGVTIRELPLSPDNLRRWLRQAETEKQMSGNDKRSTY